MTKWSITCGEKRSWRNLWRGKVWIMTNDLEDFAEVQAAADMCRHVFDCVVVEEVKE